MTDILDSLADIDLFADLSKRELRSVRQLMTQRRIEAGTELITEGDIGREAYLLLDGSASVWRKGRLVASVGPGTVIGEMAVLTGISRTATVRAEVDLDMAVLARREFLSLLDTSPSMTRKLLVSTVNRIQELEPGLLQ